MLGPGCGHVFHVQQGFEKQNLQLFQDVASLGDAFCGRKAPHSEAPSLGSSFTQKPLHSPPGTEQAWPMSGSMFSKSPIPTKPSPSLSPKQGNSHDPSSSWASISKFRAVG